VIWERIAGLPLVVEDYSLERLEAEGYERATTQIRLSGGGELGIGEDVGMDPPGPILPLAGHWTLASFCEHLGTLDAFSEPPEWESYARAFRNWAYESAALDLALRQAGVSLADAVGRPVRPLRFVNSLGLGDPPSVETIARRWSRYPSIHFKLDAAPSWTVAIAEELAGLGCVRIVDFKGRYELPVEDEDALVAMYGAVLDAFGEALLEDPHALPRVQALIAPVRDRVSFDAPIRTVADVGATRTVNIKPSRIGALRPLFALYEWCDANGVAMYGGGMGELGVGRGQIELLAALFHPDGPNDVAPSAFNAPELAAGLPSSPLVLDGLGPGFRWGYAGT
jgi:L-alanine-DL-glutamate epimerase-like enolase superfamily enzyme